MKRTVIPNERQPERTVTIDFAAREKQTRKPRIVVLVRTRKPGETVRAG